MEDRRRWCQAARAAVCPGARLVPPPCEPWAAPHGGGMSPLTGKVLWPVHLHCKLHAVLPLDCSGARQQVSAARFLLPHRKRCQRATLHEQAVHGGAWSMSSPSPRQGQRLEGMCPGAARQQRQRRPTRARRHWAACMAGAKGKPGGEVEQGRRRLPRGAHWRCRCRRSLRAASTPLQRAPPASAARPPPCSAWAG